MAAETQGSHVWVQGPRQCLGAATAHLSASAVWLDGGNLVKAANSCKKRCSMASMPVCDTSYQGDPGSTIAVQ